MDFLKPGSYKAKLYHDAPASGTLGFDVRVQNCGGVNAVLSWIELWSTEKPAKSLDYRKPKGMSDAPKGYHLVAADDCGVQGSEPHLVSGSRWKYSAAEVPISVCDDHDPARTINYGESAVVYRFGDLSRTARYKLRVMYLSHNDSRSQRLLVNDRELHGKLALPKQEIVCREFDIPASEVKNLPPEALQTKIAVDDLVVDSETLSRSSCQSMAGLASSSQEA